MLTSPVCPNAAGAFRPNGPNRLDPNMYPVPQRIGTKPGGDVGPQPSGSDGRRVQRLRGQHPDTVEFTSAAQISANRDSSSAVETVLDDGTTLVRNSAVLENGMICCGVPPTPS